MPQKQEIDICWDSITRIVDELISCLNATSNENLNRNPYRNGNSLFVIATHTLGNIRQNILGNICDKTIIRDRDSEFLSSGNSSDGIIRNWTLLKDQIPGCLKRIPDSHLDIEKEPAGRGNILGHETLFFVAQHAAEHLGQAQITSELIQLK